MGIMLFIKNIKSPLYKSRINKKMFCNILSLSNAPQTSLLIANAQRLLGKITSISTEKTVTVVVDRLSEHPIYKKRSKVSKKYLAHTEEENCKIGDMVELYPCRPLSKRKRFISR